MKVKIEKVDLRKSDGQLTIDDGNRSERRTAKCSLSSTDASDIVTVDYERRNGSSGCIEIPKDLLMPHLSHQPERSILHMVHSTDGTSRALGPFTRRDSAIEIAKGRGEHGTNGVVKDVSCITWREAGTMLAYQVHGDPVKVSEALPADAAVDAILAELSAGKRTIMERALGRA